MSNNNHRDSFWQRDSDGRLSSFAVGLYAIPIGIVIIGIFVIFFSLDDGNDTYSHETWQQRDHRLIEAGCIPMADDNWGHVTLWNKECNLTTK